MCFEGCRSRTTAVFDISILDDDFGKMSDMSFKKIFLALLKNENEKLVDV